MICFAYILETKEIYCLIELSLNYNLQQNAMVKVENEMDVQNENNSIDIKSHEVYVSSILIEEIKSEVSCFGHFYTSCSFLGSFS